MRYLAPTISALSLTSCLLLGLLLTACGGGGGDGGGGPMMSELVTANAGSDASADERTSVSLTGDVADPSSALAGVKWTQVSGPAATIQNDTNVLASFTAPEVPFGAATSLVFRLSAADTNGGVSTDDVTITVNSKEQLVVRDNNNRYHLVDVQTAASTPVNMPIPAGRTVFSTAVSPDGKHLAYVADQDTLGVQEVYVTNIATMNNAKVSKSLVSGGDVTLFFWAADSQRIVYSADADIDDTRELYSVQADGTGQTKVSHPVVGGTTITWIELSPDGSKVAYLSDITATLRQYVAPIAGGASVEVSGAVPAGVAVQAARTNWSPDSTMLSFEADQHLYVGAADGSSSQQVDQSATSASLREWAPDSSRLAYSGDDDTAGFYELYVWSPAGSLKVSGTLMSSGVFSASWSPDGSRIAYTANQDFNDRTDVYTAKSDGTGSVRCSNVVSGADVDDAEWAPDGSRLAYLGSESGSPNVKTLHTVLPDGTGHINVSDSSAVHLDDDFLWTPDSSRLVFSSVVVGGDRMVYSGSATTMAPILLNGPLVANEDASPLDRTGVSPDGSAIVYTAQEAGSPTRDMHVSDLMGTVRTRVAIDKTSSARWYVP